MIQYCGATLCGQISLARKSRPLQLLACCVLTLWLTGCSNNEPPTQLTPAKGTSPGKSPAPSDQERILSFSSGDILDLGDVQENTIVEKSVKVTNVSNKECTIDQDVKTSCGCTSAKVDKETLAPGDSCNLTMGFEAKSAVGSEIDLRITLAITQGERLVHQRLSIIGKLPAAWRIFPDRIDILCNKGNSNDVRLRVLGAAGSTEKSTVVKDLKAGTQMIKFTSGINGVFSPEKPCELLVNVQAPEAPGEYSDEIQIITNHPSAPVKVVPVRLVVRPNYELVPSTLVFNHKAQKSGEESVKEVSVITRNNCQLDPKYSGDGNVSVKSNGTSSAKDDSIIYKLVCTSIQESAESHGISKGKLDIVVTTQTGESEILSLPVMILR